MSTTNRTIVEIHALETTAAANLNRDDTGSPKTVEYGGYTRARVSSQAWKRPTRMMFRDSFDASDLGVRTKHVVEILGDRIMSRDPEIGRETAIGIAECVLRDGAGIKLDKPRKKKDADDNADNDVSQSKYLLFMGNRQYDQLTDIAIDALGTEDPAKTVKSNKKTIKQIVMNDRSIDVAMFGRMVADDTDLNVDAAAQVAHAISVQAIEPESDFFTAVDDKQDRGDEDGAGDAGAAMIGQVEFNAATFYRYANVDANRLNDTLGDVAATAKAVSVFVRSFVSSMPQGKSNSFANGTLPDLIVVNVRDTQAVNLVGAFERPVEPDYVQHATEALVKRERDFDNVYGITPVKTWVVRIGQDTEAADSLVESPSTLKEMLEGVEQVVASRLNQE
ncbi:type I-E CRISPR-associated protein Cas7/Cse4/CasC [Bifidobacterium scardovii]|uniref:CRISPR-associated protein Cse4 n=1 Tax=Bifidobacterium scardovii TaxID=158787 RepID=A0A087DGW4_9BIFI|nr:type I-E CRISPR-associated protein Cas7/Cse4/CasC [Bifidobacterium scardovii]KFI94764.1 CRISPR-associated protein Cse4 [Bifidobacterium scardovii]MDK6349899.1 type I-E CRISPR-associated protein Cas7/Cse4/CasC [Bifidobacterium scardovii]MDU8981924.1 type I-E CRISPR-associated protein Cas7/Cse4/CasC [Bifidobacterium scardovii]